MRCRIGRRLFVIAPPLLAALICGLGAVAREETNGKTISEPALTLRGHDNAIYSLAFSPDGKRLASVSADQTVRLWNVEKGQEDRALKGHTNQVLRVAFSPDGARLASASADNTVRVWSVASGEEVLS